MSSDDYCRAVTRKRKPCSKRPLPRSRFCFFHYPRGHDWGLPIATLLIGVAVTIGASLFFEERSHDTSARIAYATAFGHEIAGANVDTISVGKSSIRISEGTFPVLPGLAVVLRGRGATLSGKLVNEGGATIAFVQDSALYLLPGLGYDINSDGRFLEVVDGAERPIVQLAVGRSGELLTVQGAVWHFEGGAATFFVCTVRIGCEGFPTEEEGRAAGKLEPLFKYPAYRHHGVRAASG